MNLTTIAILVLLLTNLARVSYLASVGNVTLSKEEFFGCLGRMEAPAVLVTQRSFLWLLGAARYHYTCVYKGNRLHLRSFLPLDLPPSADAIQVRRW